MGRSGTDCGKKIDGFIDSAPILDVFDDFIKNELKSYLARI